jgi:uncharacterized membrane protein
LNPKQAVIGTIIGAITLQVVGYLIFEVILSDFYRENVGFAIDAFRAGTVIWALVLASLSFSALITFCVLSDSSALTVRRGFVLGSAVGFLVWLGIDFTAYAFTHLWTLTIVIFNPIMAAIHNGIAGAAIAFVLAKTTEKAG